MYFTQDNFEIRKAKVIIKSFPLDTIGKRIHFFIHFKKYSPTFSSIIVIYVNPTHRTELFSAASHYVALHYITRIKSTLISTTIMYNVRASNLYLDIFLHRIHSYVRFGRCFDVSYKNM